MGDLERPELLPNCEVPARRRQPDDATVQWLIKIADETLDEAVRVDSLTACAARGGAALAAASFIVRTEGPQAEALQRVAALAGVDPLRPSYSAGEFTVGLCYVVGAKGLPHGLRHRATDALVHRALDAGYAEARHLLPRSDWQWLADAVRDGWARLTALSFMDDTTPPIALRMRVARAFAEHGEQSAGHVPDCLTRLVKNQDAASSDRLAVAMAVAQRGPEAGVELLSLLAADPLVQRKHRMQAIELLDTAEPGKALELRARQTRLPSSRSAREQYRLAEDQAKQQAREQGHRQSAKAVTRRLDTEIEAIVEGLRERGSAEDLADELDDHIAEHDWAGVSSDVAGICDLVLDKQVEVSLQILKVLHRVRYGEAASSTSRDAAPNQPVKEDFPRLTREDLVAYARREAELSWCRWKTVVEKHGWANDRLREVDDQAEQAAREVAESVEEKTGDHLREVCNHLVFESWPALVDAAEEGDHAAAKSLLATTRALAHELVSADKLWRASIAEEVTFDPLTLSWPHDFWVTLDEWRRAERRSA